MSHFRTGHTLGYQKHSMETVIVARLFRAADLILQSENDGGRVGNGKWFHSPIKPQLHHYAQLLMSLCLVARTCLKSCGSVFAIRAGRYGCFVVAEDGSPQVRRPIFLAIAAGTRPLYLQF